jgi:hypothetical protein
VTVETFYTVSGGSVTIGTPDAPYPRAPVVAVCRYADSPIEACPLSEDEALRVARYLLRTVLTGNDWVVVRDALESTHWQQQADRALIDEVKGTQGD